MLELPVPSNLDVIVLVTRRQPELLIVFTESEWAHEVPDALRLVARHFDARIEDIVLGEADALGKTLEQFA